jgi:hypothetical protein
MLAIPPYPLFKGVSVNDIDTFPVRWYVLLIHSLFSDLNRSWDNQFLPFPVVQGKPIFPYQLSLSQLNQALAHLFYFLQGPQIDQNKSSSTSRRQQTKDPPSSQNVFNHAHSLPIFCVQPGCFVPSRKTVSYTI